MNVINIELKKLIESLGSIITDKNNNKKMTSCIFVYFLIVFKYVFIGLFLILLLNIFLFSPC